MKKQCNRILAMLLALVTMLSVLPISAIAAPWLDVEQETTTNGTVTSNNITITLDAKALLGYLKDRDINGLISGLSVNGLGDVISTETLFEIIPEEKFTDIVMKIQEDVTPEMLLKYIDLDAMLRDIDTEALIELVMGLEDLTKYIKDDGYEILMNYVDAGKFAEAIPYVDVERLAKDNSEVLLDLVLDLDTDQLFALVDLEAAIHLENVDLLEAVKIAYLVEKLGGYDVLYNEYTDKTAMDQFLKDNFMLWADLNKDGVIDSDFIDKYIDIAAFRELVDDPAFNKDDFVDDLALEQYIYQLHEDGLLDYSNLKVALDTDALLNDMKDVNSPFRQDPAIQDAVKNAIKNDPSLRERLEGALLNGDNSTAFKTLMKDLLKENEEFGALMKDILKNDSEFLPLMKDILKNDSEFLPLMKDILKNDSEFLPLMKDILKNDGEFLPLMKDILKNDSEFLPLMKDILKDNASIRAQIEAALSDALTAGNYGYETFASYIDEAKAEEYLKALFAGESPEFFNSYFSNGTFDVAKFYAENKNDPRFNTDAFLTNSLKDTVSRDDILEDLMNSADFNTELDRIFNDLQSTDPTLFNETVDTVFNTLQNDHPALFNKTVDTVFNTLQNDHPALFNKTVDTVFNTLQNNNPALFNKTLDTVFDTLQNDNPTLFNKTVDTLFNSLQTDHSDLFEELIDAAYEKDPAVLNEVIQDMMDSDPETFNKMLETVLDEVLTNEIFADDANHLKLDNLMSYIMFDKLIDIPGLEPETLSNKGIVDYTALDVSLLIKHNMIKVEDLFNDGVIEMDAISDMILMNKLTDKIQALAAAGELDYGELVDANNLKTQILDLLAAKKLNTDQVFNCIVKDAAGNPDYNKVINAIPGGAKAVVDAITNAKGVSYGAIIQEYVLDGQLGNLINALGAADILTALISDGQMNNAFKVNELIADIGFDKLMELIDIRSLITQLYNDGAIQSILQEVDSDTYIACINILLNALHNNVREIKLNEVVITKYNSESSLLNINVEKLMQAIQTSFPTLEELAEIEGDVLIDGLGFSITYIPEGGTETKTHEINVTVKLIDGVDRVRETAIKIKNLLNRYLTYSYENNDIVFELRLPSQFATAMKLTLNSLSAEDDPALLQLRDELLALYDANLTDTANFIQNLTLEQTVALLEKVDTTALTNAYNKLMKQRYVEIVLEYIERATGKDLAGVEIGTLMDSLADLTVPTVEQVAEKVEELTGRDLVSLLPARVEGVWESAQQRQIAEILDSIAAKVGADTDIKQLLQNANATDDPLQYLYDEFVNILENSENVYVAIRARVLDVYRRVISSKVGAHFNTYRLDELYMSDGKFRLEESLEINPKTYITRALDKVIELVLQGRQLDQDLLENVKTIALGMIDDAPFTFHVSGTLTVDGLYRASFYDYDATASNGLKLLGEFFLPVGTDLKLLMPYTTGDPAIVFEGWSENGKLHATMPAKDVVLLPKTNDISCTITVYAPGQIGQTPAWGGTGLIGSKIADDVIAILQSKPVKTWDDDTVTWYVVENGVKTDRVWDFANDVLEGDLVLTWEITHAIYTVQVVDPDSKEPVTGGDFTVTRGETLSADQIAAMNALVPDYVYGYTWHLVDENGQIVSAEFDPEAEIHSAIRLTWVYNPEPLPEYTITVLDPDGNPVGNPITVEQGTTLESIKDQLIAKTDSATKGLVPAWYEVATDVESITASDYIALNSTPIMDHYVLTWRYQTITIYDHSNPTAAPITFELGDDNTGISTAFLTEKASLDADNAPAWYALAYPNAPTKGSTAITGSTDKVIWDQSYTWKYFTITYYNTHNPALTYTINNIGAGKTLADYQAALNAQAGATAEKLPAWYAVDSMTGEPADSAISDFGAVSIDWDLTVAWKYYVVTIHDPSDYNNTVSFEMGVNQALTRDMLETAANIADGKHPAWYSVDGNGVCGDKFTAFGAALTGDLDLTWKFHRVNVWDDAGNLLGYVEVDDCDDDGNAIKLESLKNDILALVTLISGKDPAWYVADANGAFNAQSSKVDWTADILGDRNIAWKYYTVNVYDYTTDQLITSVTLGDGQSLNNVYEGTLSYIDYLNAQVALAEHPGKVPAWYLYTDGNRGASYQNDLGNALGWDMDLTWHYPVVSIEIYGSTGAENADHIHYPSLAGNSYLVSYDSTFAALIAQVSDKYIGYEEYLLSNPETAWMGVVYTSFHNEWKQDADGAIDLDQSAKITDDVTIYLYIVPDTTKPGFSIGDDHQDFEITFEDDIIYVTLNENAWRDHESFTLNFTNLGAIISDAHAYGITFTNAGGTQSVHMSHEMLEALYGAMCDEYGNPIATTATLVYTALDVYDEGFLHSDWTPKKEWGCDAIGYSYEFAFADADGQPVAVDFFGDLKDGEVRDYTIDLTFAFAGKGNTSGNGSSQTFLYVDGLETNGWIAEIQDGSVKVSAQHFSQLMLVNKYELSYHESAFAWDSSLADFNLLPFDQIGAIFNGDQFVSGYYAAGEPLEVNASFALLDRYLGKLSHVKTDLIDAIGNTVLGSDPASMPEQPAKLQYIISTPVYHVYYYMYNAGGAGVTPGYYYAGELAYTRYDAEKLSWSTVSGYLPELLGTGAWYGIDEAGWNQCIYGSPKDVYLVWGEDDAPVEDIYTVTFKWDDENGTTFTIKMSLVEWISHGIGSLLGPDGLIAIEINNNPVFTVADGEIIKWNISIDGKTYELSDLTVEQWIKLFNESATTPIVFEADRTARYYTISTDGNIVDLKPDSQARPGDQVTFMPVFKEGMMIDIKLYADGVDISDQVHLLSGLGCFSFEMPAADVYIKVVYTPRTFSYVDQNGTTHEDIPYGEQITYTVVIPASRWVDFTKLDAAIKAFHEDMILISSVKAENGDLVLTYALTLTEDGIDFTVLQAQTDALIKGMSYIAGYVVNGVYYSTIEEALAACPDGVKVIWTPGEGIYANLLFASFEKAEEDNTALIWMIVLLAVLILILIIVILYVLYICGKIGPNWFLKGITAIVSAFFAVCMGVAYVVLAVVRFLGHEENELMEKEVKSSPASEPENDPEPPTEAVVAPIAEVEAAPAEETAVESAEEATEEVIEESTAESTEESNDSAKTATADEAIEISVEDVVDETIEEVLTDATEENATEEVTEESTEETAEEATAEESEDETK